MPEDKANLPSDQGPFPPDSQNDDRQKDDADNEQTAMQDEYPGGLRLTLISASLILTTFLVALDATIIATAIPAITAEFGSLSDVAWYNAAFLLTTCAFQLPFGRAYSLLTTKWTYLASVILFEIGSAVCGAAPTSTALIVGRAVAGIGSAGIFCGAFIIIAATVALDKRAIFTGTLGAAFGIASVVGPLLGGAFTTNVTWRWCFYINLPLGGVALVVGFFCLTNDVLEKGKDSGSLRGKTWLQILNIFDLPGTAILIPSIVCLLLALQWGGQRYPWSDGRVIALLVVFGVSILGWATLQYFQGDNATIPKKVASQRSVACASLFICFGSAGFIILVYYLPIWFQGIKGDSAEASGIHVLPMILSVVVFAIVSGGFVVILGYYVPWMIFGSILMTIGAGLLSTLKSDSGIGEWLGYQIIFGAGVGCSLEQCNIAVQTVLPHRLVPAGTSLVVFARSLGGSIGVSIAENVFEQRLQQLLAQKLPRLPAHLVSQSGATNLINQVRVATGGNEEIVQAVLHIYDRAITAAFYPSVALGGLTLFCAFGIEWKSVKKEKKEKKKREDAEKSPQSNQQDER